MRLTASKVGSLRRSARVLRESPPVRPAGGHFHLRAQMKVTKAKGLKTDLTGSPVQNPRTTSVPLKRSLAAEAMHPRTSVLRIEGELFVGCCQGSDPDRFLAPLLGSLSFGAANESDRQAGATAGLSRSERDHR